MNNTPLPDAIQDGTRCQRCGHYIGDGQGNGKPRSCVGCASGSGGNARYELRRFNDPELYVVCREVTPAEDINDLVHAMKIAMLEHNGIGLAAPQVGSDLRVIIVGCVSSSGTLFTVMVNPTVTKISDRTSFDYEGCLSFPGVRAWIKRQKHVKVAYTDELGVEVERNLFGLEARILQHELDHLVGICLVGSEWRRQLILNPSAEAIR